ncbi:MAG: Gfo/Idh/MocA family oxidoreductase [Coriobacteriia bacterium]
MSVDAVRAIVVGCGSIGRRHVANLLDAGADKVTVVSSYAGCGEHFGGDPRVSVAGSLDAAFGDVAVVANDTVGHLAAAVALAERGVDLLVEKPLAASTEGVEALRDAAARSGAGVAVAYNMRLLPALRRVRDIVASGALGRLYFARFEVGQYLPDWRAGRDYRETYSAHSDRGGGVALDLSHELDCMRFFFGDPAHWKVLCARASELEIDSEDVFEGMYAYASGFACSVHLDYLEKGTRRRVRIVGSNGEIECDLAGKRTRIVIDGVETLLTDPALFDMAATYVAETAEFLATRGRGGGLASLEDGVWALRLLEDGHESGGGDV